MVAVHVSFNVHVDGAPSFLYPAIPIGLSPLTVPLAPGPLPYGGRTSVQAFLFDDDPSHASNVSASVLSYQVSPALPSGWGVVETAGPTFRKWTFRPDRAGSFTFRARFEVDSFWHPEDGEEFSGALSVQFVDPKAITLSDPLPITYRVRVGNAPYQDVSPGSLVRVPADERVQVRYRHTPYDSATGLQNHLWDRDPIVVSPGFPAHWSSGYSQFDGWRFRGPEAGTFSFSATATLLESFRASPHSVPTRRNLRRGRAGIQVSVVPGLPSTQIESLEDRGRIDPANPRPDDIPLMGPDDFEGVWIDPLGNEVYVEGEGDRVAMSFAAGEGTLLSGTRQDQDLTLQGQFRFLGDVPLAHPAGLTNGPSRYVARIADDGRTISGQLAPVDPADGPGAPLVLTRQSSILAVATVCTSLRIFLQRTDARGAWDDDSLVGPLMWAEADPVWDHAHVLVVVGNYLPQEGSQADPGGTVLPVSLTETDIPSTDTRITYRPDRFWKTRHSGGYVQSYQLAPVIFEPLWEHAWKLLAEARGEATALQMRNYADALLVVAVPEQGVLPGMKSFRVNGRDAQWMLREPVTRGNLDFVRNVKWPDVWLSVESLVRNMDFHVQLKVAETIDLETVDVELKLGGDGDRRITLTRLPADPKTYRSERLMIAMRGEAPSSSDGATVIESAADEVVLEQTRPLVRLASPVTRAQVVTIPTLLGAYYPFHLSVAASVHGVPAVDETVVETFHNLVVLDSTITLSTGIPPGVASSPVVSYIPLVRGYSDLDYNISIPVGIPGLPHLEISPGIRSTEVAMGNHGAALLLREMFRRMIEPVRDQLREALASDENLAAFLRARYDSIVRGADPLSLIEVEDADGDDDELRRAIAIGQLRQKFATKAAAMDFARAKSRRAIRTLLDAVEEAHDHAVGVADDDIEELLKLTGHGFQSVVSRAMPLLARRTDISSASGDYLYRTDENGVRWVGDVKYVAELLQANQDLASADTNVLMAAAAVVPLFLPAGLLRALVAAGMGAFDLAEFGLSLYDQHREMTFALGASPVIGRDRFSVAQAKELPLWALIATAGLTALGAAGDLADVLGNASIALARARATRLLGRFESGGLDELRRMDADDQRDLLVAIFDARLVAREADGVVDSRTARLLQAADALEEQAAALGRAERAAARAAEGSADLADAVPSDLRDRIPVVVDPTFPPAPAGAAAEVRLMYEIDELGFVSGLSVRVASGATQADVASHVATLRRMDEYTQRAHEARGILARLRRWVGRFGEPPPGSVAWESILEVDKLSSVLIEDRIARLAAGRLDPGAVAVQQDIAWLGEQLAYHARVAASLDRNPGRGFVAAHSVATMQQAVGAASRRVIPAVDLQELADHIVRTQARMAELAAAGSDHAALAALQMRWLRQQVGPAQAQAAFDQFLRISGREDIRIALMRNVGFHSILADLVESPAKYLGAHWALRFNALVVNQHPSVGQELLGLVSSPIRLFEDMSAVTPRSILVPPGGVVPERSLAQAIDQVLMDGTMLEFKSYQSWAAVVARIEKQAKKTFLRYNDAGWVDGSNRSLNGRYIVVIDSRRLQLPASGRARNRVRDRMTRLGQALSDWGNERLPDAAPLIDVRIFIV